MAGVGVDSSSTDCPVCSEEFTDPKLLACNHLVCRKCVLDWLTKAGHHGGCPLCRAPILPSPPSSASLPPSGPEELERLVEALPTDFSMVAKVESQKVLSSSHVCMYCDNHVPATSFCLQCNMKLCAACSKGHRKIPSLKNHVIEDLNQLTPQRLVEINRCTCKNHDDRLAEMYCSTHQSLICLLCSSTNHRGCEDVKAIKEAAQVKREELRTQAQKLTDLEEEMKTEIANVTDTFKAMHKKVKDIFNDLEHELARRRQEVCALIQAEEDKVAVGGMDQQRAALASHVTVINNLLTSAPDDALLNMASKMKERCFDLDRQTTRRSRVKVTSDVFDEMALARLKSAIASLGVETAMAMGPAAGSSVVTASHTSAATPKETSAVTPKLMAVVKTASNTSKPTGADLVKVLKKGDRVKPGPNFCPWRDKEFSVKHGTVIAFPSVRRPGHNRRQCADVRWDNGHEDFYHMGLDNQYELDLVLRHIHGEYHHLMPQLLNDPERFAQYFRMKPHTFYDLLEHCAADLKEKSTNFCRAVSPEERLVVTLRFLATGESFRSLSFHFRLGVSTVRVIIKKTVKVLFKKLQPLHMPAPDENMWTKTAEEFFQRWNFPLCVGAIDGKHVQLKAPFHSGSQYYNYKSHHSIVLMAIVDATGKFLVIDVGGFGSCSDGGIFQDSSFFKLLKTNKLNLPKPAKIPNTGIELPYMFVGDEAFALMPNLMRPFPRRFLNNEKRIFNYRLSRARRQVECTFGVISSMWRIMRKPIEVEPNFATDMVKAVCVLHNYIKDKEPECTRELIQNDSHIQQWEGLPHDSGRARNEAMAVRNALMSYFLSPTGSLPWQTDLFTNV